MNDGHRSVFTDIFSYYGLKIIYFFLSLVVKKKEIACSEFISRTSRMNFMQGYIFL